MAHDIENEIWKDIEGYEGRYQVSNMGRVKSLSRTTIQKQVISEIILAPLYNIDKYLCVNLWIDGKMKQVKIHRLVGIAFIPNPEEKPHINHRFGIKIDNRASELEWNTVSENNLHAWKTGLKIMTDSHRGKIANSHRGAKAYQAKLVLNTQSGIFYDTIMDAAASVPMGWSYLASILRGKFKNKTNFILA